MISIVPHDELGLGLAGGDDIDGFFGDILGGLKSVAGPALTAVGGAVGTLVAPGVGTAAGAWLGGKVGGAVSGGGGGGAAPAATVTARASGFSGYSAPRAATGPRKCPPAPAGYGRHSHDCSLYKKRDFLAEKKDKTMSTGTKVAIGVGGVGALAGLGYLAWVALL